ncbi:hypothetical protein [Streptomyces flaveolus]|uniref:hypothetical protein n=1 Tax=Streptomyces flaveolus TaxID=67297 RepID=UPI0033D1C229
MTRSARALCFLHGMVSLWLVFCTLQQVRHGSEWAAFGFAVTAVVPVLAIVRECELADTWELVGRTPLFRPQAAARAGQDDTHGWDRPLDCCERWWTALGTEHDAHCPKRHVR